jgi:hypothetical protein
MNMMKNAVLLLLLCILVSCASVIEGSKNEPIAPPLSTIADKFIVSLPEARIIAEYQPHLILKQNQQQNTIQSGDDAKLSILKRKISRTFTIQEQSSPYLYILNYEGGGFVVLSADERQIPVLAYSETGAINEKAVPEGFILWAGKNKEDIEMIRTGKREANVVAAKEWEKLRRSVGILPIKDKSAAIAADCATIMTTIGPLLTTIWGQDCDIDGGYNYNSLIPLSCSTFCGYAPTGCVTTAVAQVLKFWSYPSGSYSWSSMPVNSATYETARLMRDVAGFLNSTYSCSGTGAFMSAIPNVFKNGTFQYANADFIGTPVANASYPILISELNQGRPIILGGFTGTFLGLWPTGTGHTWVCDGYQRTVYLNPCSGEYAYFHMNWGWDGYGSNAWYYQNDWAAGPNSNFQYHKEMIANIRP